MSDHPSLERIVQYRDGALAPDELLGVDDHLATCATCRDRAQTLSEQAGRLESALVASGPRDHVDFDTLSQYVDGTLVETDREIADAHLSSCSLCAEDLGDLRRTRAELSGLAPVTATPGWPWLAFFLSGRGALAGAAALAVVAAVWAVRPGSTGRPVTTAKPVAPVATHAPAPGAPPTMAALRDGPFAVTVDEHGNLTGLPELPAADRIALVKALTSGRLDVGGVTGLGGHAGVLMGESPGSTSESLSAAAPVATAVESDRPTFKWTAHRGALGYVVTIYDDQFNEVARSSEGLRLEWTPASRLARGVTYSWQVTARTAQGAVSAPVPPAAEARFRVVDANTAAGLERARRSYAIRAWFWLCCMPKRACSTLLTPNWHVCRTTMPTPRWSRRCGPTCARGVTTRLATSPLGPPDNGADVVASKRSGLPCCSQAASAPSHRTESVAYHHETRPVEGVAVLRRGQQRAGARSERVGRRTGTIRRQAPMEANHEPCSALRIHGPLTDDRRGHACNRMPRTTQSRLRRHRPGRGRYRNPTKRPGVRSDRATGSPEPEAGRLRSPRLDRRA